MFNFSDGRRICRLSKTGEARGCESEYSKSTSSRAFREVRDVTNYRRGVDELRCPSVWVLLLGGLHENGKTRAPVAGAGIPGLGVLRAILNKID